MHYELLTDSPCDLPIEIIKKYGINTVNFTFHMEGKEYVDDMGITMDNDVVFEKLKNGSTSTTSQVSTGTYYEVFKSYAEKNISLLYLAFSSQLSGSYQSAVSALQMLKEEIKDPKITIIDTQAASLGEGLLVYEAAKLKEQGKSLDDVAQWVEENKCRVQSWVTVDDIKHLQRGGRISATSAVLGTLLNVKPIIVVNKSGKLVPFAKVRGRKKALQYLVDMTVEHITDAQNSTIIIGHAGALEESQIIKRELEERMNPAEVIIATFGPVVASHTGYGSLAVFSLGKPREIE